MRRIHAELHPRATQFDHHQVGPLGGMLLLTVREREPADIQSVVDALGRDKSQISRLIKRLERKGLLIREQSASDGRISRISLTETGRAQLSEIETVLTEIIDELFANLSPKEKTMFSKTLAKVLGERQ